MELVTTAALCSGCFPHHASSVHDDFCICGCPGKQATITHEEAQAFEDRITAALEKRNG